MLDLVKNEEGKKLTIALVGRLDTVTSPDFEKELTEVLPETEELVLDFSELDYVSSAGLRVILAAQKLMNKQGSMKVINVCKEVMEIFEVTGFSEILTIEEQETEEAQAAE